jgi:RNA polymerase sigma-70 factor (ECF subfamily)
VGLLGTSKPAPKDEAAIAEAYRRYGHALHRRVLGLVGNPEDARELVQEVFCQFWRRREFFEGKSSMFTYLYRIATNLAIDRLRRKRTAGAQVELDETGHAAPAGAPDRSVAAAMELAELTCGLDDETLTIAVMANVDGLTQDEIAEALQLSRRTVGKRLKRFESHTRTRADIVHSRAPRIATE